MTSKVGQKERRVQQRLVKLITDRLNYRYEGSWQDRAGNANIEEPWLEAWLVQRGYDQVQISKAIHALRNAAAVNAGHDLYEANREVYGLLRYGVGVKTEAGVQTETVDLIDWENPENNDFVLVEEVTVVGVNTKRPDLVVYVNGIALVVVELKRSIIGVTEGIRQTIGNQKPEYIRPFFSTVQLTLAGNDTQGLWYAPILTPEKYWLRWRLPKDVPAALQAQIESKCAGLTGLLDPPVAQMLDKHRLLQFIHDFVVFEKGVRKAARPNQYFGVRAAQERAAAREGGLIWHTQGSGKSLTMVWLAQWLHENQPDARVLLITDRTELDEQIEGVFEGVGEKIYKTSSGQDLIAALGQPEPWLICSLVHKFRPGVGARDEPAEEDDASRNQETAQFILQLRAGVPDGWGAQGNLFVFVDEAHRTQSGKLHSAMKELLPDAMFIGFTGTPLLRTEKAASLRTFGTFIHTYKYDEAVADGVVLDLRYEARNIEQELTSPEKVDKWFDARTGGLSDAGRAELKKRWGTMQALYSSTARTRKIVADVEMDMMTKPRLMSGEGNAMLVTSSIYQACRFYEEFSKGPLNGRCAIVSSYHSDATKLSKEDAGEGQTELMVLDGIYRRMLADHFGEAEEKAILRIEEFETAVKQQFVDHPAQMQLLIVVDKLLTGFDAPSATYLYIDKKMRDHGLFQAICRVNRLDGEGKEYGYVIDYRDLFKSLERAVDDYTGEAFDDYDQDDIDGLITNRLIEGRKDLDEALERIEALCEPVEQPKESVQYLAYFCGDVEDPEALQINEPKRVELYKTVAALARRYADLANDMPAAGYTVQEAAQIKTSVAHYVAAANEIKLGSGDYVDLKRYEPDMRRLLDTYVSAKDSETISEIGDEDMGVIELIVSLGDQAPGALTARQGSAEAAAATIVNNVRRLIIDQGATNPKYFDQMSKLLEALIAEQKKSAEDYEDYLRKLAVLARKVAAGEAGESEYPGWADTGARRALHDFGLPEGLVVEIDGAVLHSKRAHWVGSRVKEKQVRTAVERVLPGDFDRTDELMDLIKARVEYV